jgi:Cellulose binding domain
VRRRIPAPVASATAAAAALGLVLLAPGPAAAHPAPAGGHGAVHAHHGHGHPWGHHWYHHGHPGHPGQPPTDPTDPPTDPVACMALYNVTGQTDGGFLGTVEVMNHTTLPMEGWTVTWKPGLDTVITAVDGGTLTAGDDGTVTVRNAASNATVPPDGEVTFDFTATSTGNDYPIGSMGCTSP